MATNAAKHSNTENCFMIISVFKSCDTSALGAVRERVACSALNSFASGSGRTTAVKVDVLHPLCNAHARAAGIIVSEREPTSREVQ